MAETTEREMSSTRELSPGYWPGFWPGLGLIGAAQEYWLDAWQRSVLFLDILRERGDTYWAQRSKIAPNVLTFEPEVIVDGRTLDPPANYGLARIKPLDGTRTDLAKAPFVVVDPRAGHGPGIGGMKQDSEIGMALEAGHPCYFIGFTPRPMPGQTVEDVCKVEAELLEEVIRRHPDVGKPVVVANCQAGWQIMMTAAVRPELFGAILAAGAPLAYWAGVRGKNPLRYLGGMLGGTWLTALTGDLGAGIFDGANLVANFESLNPANTFWRKPYNVYSKVDTEGPRFLDFETWWGGPTLLNAEEMQWIADNLFVGDRLATGALRTSEGLRIDLRNIKSPIIVFCSWGDNITPPQQALDWITEIYDDERELVANGQTIVYTLHQSIGHLGIFVSGKVATKEHREFVACMDLIQLMPPGLYEAVITEVEPDTEHRDLIQGRYLFSLEARTFSDIRALGGNTPEDDLRFATAARVSDINLSLYETFLAPWVRMGATPAMAEAMRRLHPNRLRFSIFSDKNPMMQPIEPLARRVRASRMPASSSNPFKMMEAAVSSWIGFSLEAWGRTHDALTETTFLTTYGSPVLQAMVGLGPQARPLRRHMERDLVREADEARMRSELEGRFEAGGPVEAAFRGLIYVRLPDGGTDERAFAVLKALREAQPVDGRLSLEELRELLKEQYLLVRLDEERAIEAIPKLLPRNAETRRRVSDAMHRMIEARGALPPEGRRRLDRIEALFNGDAGHA
jgi:pimeloyl-ACP methyl ester carboxylesterase